METADYLNGILSEQDLSQDSTEMKQLQAHRADVESALRAKFGSDPTIRYGGSKAKGTLIKENYDLDVICYFKSDSTVAGETLEEIYASVRDCLKDKYYVEEKTSAIRLKSKDTKEFMLDFHIDVVPGRFTDEDSSDCFIYQKSAEKCRLKTNLDMHIAHVRDSGVLDAIRLQKLWKTRKSIRLKQFIWELIVIELLDKKKTQSLEKQLLHVWTEIRDRQEPLIVQDPANPSGNDFSEAIKAAWPELATASKIALATIEASGWEPVFGALKENSNGGGDDSTERLKRAASVGTPNRAWLPHV